MARTIVLTLKRAIFVLFFDSKFLETPNGAEKDRSKVRPIIPWLRTMSMDTMMTKEIPNSNAECCGGNTRGIYVVFTDTNWRWFQLSYSGVHCLSVNRLLVCCGNIWKLEKRHKLIDPDKLSVRNWLVFLEFIRKLQARIYKFEFSVVPIRKKVNDRMGTGK